MKDLKTVKQKRYNVIRKVTLIGVLTNIVLAIAQLLGGIFAHSQALIADGIHTLSDLASDFIVLVAAKIASKEADEDHHYGHGRFETLGTVILGLILSVVAIGIVIGAIDRLFFSSVYKLPENIALVFAALAILSKEGLYQYTVIKAKQIHSDLLKANAWHHRSDALSSIVVFVGISGAILFEIKWLDSLAAIFVAMMIFIMGIKLVINSVNELLESAVEPEKVKEIREVIENLDCVENLHMLRTRMLGGQIFADVHIQVASHISVSEGHLITECVLSQLHKKFPEIEDIIIHIDPEDDETCNPSANLSPRHELEKHIEPLLEQYQLNDKFIKMLLHYLDGRIEIEFFFQANDYDTEAFNHFVDACKQIKDVNRVEVYQRIL